MAQAIIERSVLVIRLCRLMFLYCRCIKGKGNQMGSFTGLLYIHFYFRDQTKESYEEVDGDNETERWIWLLLTLKCCCCCFAVASRYARNTGRTRPTRSRHGQAQRWRAGAQIRFRRGILFGQFVLVAKDQAQNLVPFWRTLFIQFCQGKKSSKKLFE